MADALTVRAATFADIATIRRIAFATWPVSYRDMLSTEQMAYMLERMYAEEVLTRQLEGGHVFLIADVAGGPVGFAGFEHGYRGAPRTRLHKLYVLPDAQRSGAGRALLEAVETAALTAADLVVELNVNKRNPARGFYERRGYAVVRDETIDIGGGHVMDDHVMERRIAPDAEGLVN